VPPESDLCWEDDWPRRVGPGDRPLKALKLRRDLVQPEDPVFALDELLDVGPQESEQFLNFSMIDVNIGRFLRRTSNC
jgi:hypothetical protein